MSSAHQGRRSMLRCGLLGFAIASDSIYPDVIVTLPVSWRMVSYLIMLPLLLLGVRWEPGVLGSRPEAHPTPLPRYHLESGGDNDHQPAAAEGPVALLRPDSVLTLTLRPQEALTGAVQVDAYLVRAERFFPWPVQPAASASGTFRLRAPVNELPELAAAARDQDIEIAFLLSRPGGAVEAVLRTRIRVSQR